MDKELLTGGNVTVGSECNGPAAAVRDELNIQVWLAVVVDKSSDLCRNRLEFVLRLLGTTLTSMLENL